MVAAQFTSMNVHGHITPKLTRDPKRSFWGVGCSAWLGVVIVKVFILATELSRGQIVQYRIVELRLGYNPASSMHRRRHSAHCSDQECPTWWRQTPTNVGTSFLMSDASPLLGSIGLTRLNQLNCHANPVSIQRDARNSGDRCPKLFGDFLSHYDSSARRICKMLIDPSHVVQ